MVKKRLIFTLHFENGYFMLSRNFRLQRVGDSEWLKQTYDFSKIAFSIDELILLNVSREKKDITNFSNVIKEIVDTCFIPISAGGGIRTMTDAEVLMNSGADKLVLNFALLKDKPFIDQLVKKYGQQCIIASVDIKLNDDRFEVYVKNATEKIDLTFEEYLNYIQSIGVGEIYLNSIDRDGTGQGYITGSLKNALKKVDIPVILSGGAGKYQHFIEAFNSLNIDAVSTANLFNFIGDGFPIVRKAMREAGIPLADWNQSESDSFLNYFKVT